MAYNNADIDLIASLNESSSEAEILKVIKILNSRLQANANAKIKLDAEIDVGTIEQAMKKLDAISKSQSLSVDTKDSIASIQKEASAMLDVVSSAKKAAQEKSDFANANRRVADSADNTTRAIRNERNAMESLDDLDYILQNINMQGRAGNGVFQQFGNTLRDAFYAFTAANLLQDAIYKVIDGGKEAVETVKDLNDAAVSLRMATGDSYDSVKNLMSSYNSMAQELGAVTTSVTEAADEWLRQGHSVEDTNTLIADSMMLSKISNLESADSTKYLTSAMQGYKVAVKDVVGIVDKLSSVDLESATDAAGLAEAMSRTAEGAQIAGISMDRLLGMIATVGEVTQKSMSSIGESYKTVFSRMRDIKDNKLSVIGDDGEIEDLSNVEIVLDSLGIKLRDSNLEFRNFQDVLDDVAGSWDSYSSVQKAAIAKAFSGVRQQENFLVMMENWDKVLKYTDVAANSQGTGTEKFGYYLEGLESKTNSLKASLENLASTTISDELYGSVLDTTKAIVDMTSETGILKGALVGLGTAGSIYAFQQLAGYLSNATRELSNFSEALSMTKSGQVGITQMQNLINLTGNLTQSQTRLLLSTSNLTDTQKAAVLMNQRLAQGLPQITEAEALQQLQTMGVATAQEATTGATVSLTSALKGLYYTLISNPLVLITASVTAGVVAWNKYKEHLEDVRQSAYDAANAMDEQIKSVDDYVERYKELQTALQNAKGDEEATYSVKQDLLALQTELNDAFGDEYGKLNLVTDAYKDQTETIRAYKKEIAQNFLNENNEGIKNAVQKMTADNHYNLTYGGESIDNDKGKILKEIADSYADRGMSVMDEAGDGSYARFSIHLSANAEDAYKTISDFMNDVRDKATVLGNEDLFADVLEISSQSLNNANDIIDKNGEIYKEALISEIAVSDSLSASYTEAAQAVEEYNNAVLKSEDLYSDENVKNAWNHLQTIKQGISENTDEWGKYESVMADVFDHANDSIYSFYQTMQNDNSISKLTDDLQGLSDTDLRSMADDGIEDSFDRLCEKASAYGLEVQDVIDLLLQLGIAQGKIEGTTPDTPTISTFSDAWENLKTSTDEATKGFSDNLMELAEQGQLTVEAFSEADSTNYFENLGISSEEAVKKINELVSASTQLQSMSAQISKMSDMLAYKKNGTAASASDLARFDVEVRGLDSWKEFEAVMGSSKSTMEQCQKAANDLATEFVNSSNFLANLNETNRDYYVTALQNMGLEDARIIVLENLSNAGYELSDAEQAELEKAIQAREEIYALQIAEANDFIAKKDLNAAAQDAYAGLMQEAEGAGISKVALLDLIAQEQVFNNTGLSVDTKISSLSALASAYLGTAAAAQFAASTSVSGMGSDPRYYTDSYVQDKWTDTLSNYKVNFDVKPTGSSGYKSSGGSGKSGKSGGSGSSKQTIDWIERKLSSLNDKISLTQSKFENLFNIKSPKNLTGKIAATTKSLQKAEKETNKWKSTLSKIKIPSSLKKDIQSGKKIDLSKYSKAEQKEIKKYQSGLKKYNASKKKENSLENKLWDLQSSKGKDGNLKSQIKQYDGLAKAYDKAAEKYKKYADKVKLSSSLKAKVRSGDYSITDYSQKTQELIQKYEDLWKKYQDALKGKQEAKRSANEKREERYQLYVDDAEAKKAKSQAYAELDAGNYKKQNKHLEYQKKLVKESYKYQIKIAKLNKDDVEVAKLKAELQKELNDLIKQEFDNIVNTYDNKIGLTDNKIKAFQDQISLIEASGERVGSALYTKQMSLNKINLDKLVSERKELITKLAEIPKGTDDWYDAQDTLFGVDSQITQLNTDITNLQKSINQLSFDRFNDLLDMLNDITDESQFIKDMLSDTLFDDNGKITGDGMTAIGLSAMDYDVYMAEAEKYKEQIAELDSMFKQGLIGEVDYEKQLREYKQGQRDAIKSANDAKKAVIDYVEQGLNAQNDALSEAIEKQKRLLEAEKDLKEFQDKISAQNKSIADLRKQINALETDDSEENRKKLQELRAQLADAEKEQKDTLYDRSISDQEDALDKMLEDSKQAAEDYLKDTDKVFADALVYVNGHMSQIAGNIESIAKETGYDISTYIVNAWKDSGDAVGKYSDVLSSNVPNIISQISLITEQWKAQTKAIEDASKAATNAVTDNYSDYTGVGASGNGSSGNGSSKSNDKLKEVRDFINKRSKPATQKKSYYAPLNEYIYSKTGGKVLSKSDEATLGKMLGLKIKTDLRGDSGLVEINKILKALKSAGFSDGGLVNAKDVLRKTGEDGLALVKHGEYILTKEQTDAFLKLANFAPRFNIPDINRNIPVPNLTPMNVNIDSSVRVEGVATDKIVKDFEGIAKKQAENVVGRINSMAYAKGVRRR